MARKNGLNWGAALRSAGGSLQDYAEQKRREMAMQMLREQSLADRDAQREYDDQKWLERLNITDPMMPVPQDIRQFVGLPNEREAASGMSPVGGMAYAVPPIPPMERTSTVGRWQNMMPPAPKVSTENLITVTDAKGVQYPMSPRDAYSVNNPKTTPDEPMMPFTYPEGVPGLGGTTVTVPYAQYVSLVNEFYGPRGSGDKLPDPKDTTAEWYGGEKQSGSYDKDTGVATPFSYPFRGSVYDQGSSPLDLLPDLDNEVKNLQASGQTISTEPQAREVLGRVQSRYDLPLAQQLEQELGAAFQGWAQDTKMVNDKPVNIPGQYRKKNIPPGWDRVANKLDWIVEDDIKPALEFYADIVNKQLADGTDEVEMKTINAWLKKKGLTLDQLSQYIKMGQAQGVDLPAAGAAIVQQRSAAADPTLRDW